MSSWIIKALNEHVPPLTPISKEVILIDPEKLILCVEPFRFYDPDLTLLQESIEKFGQLTPIVVWQQPGGLYGYVAGSQRIAVCKALEIKVRCVLGLPPENETKAMQMFLDSNRTIYADENLESGS